MNNTNKMLWAHWAFQHAAAVHSGAEYNRATRMVHARYCLSQIAQTRTIRQMAADFNGYYDAGFQDVCRAAIA